MKKKELLKEQKKIKSQRNQVMIDLKDKNDLKKTLYVIGGVIVFIAIVFVMVNIFNGTWNLFSRENEDVPVIDPMLVMCGTMFQPTDEEYLVLAYNINNEDDDLYNVLVDKYTGNNPLYYLDLESGFNKSCVAEKSNLVADSTQIKFSGQTLLHIKDGKITNTYTTKEAIKKFLSE